MPELAEERRLAKADGRYFTVEQQQISYDGTAAVHGELDLADALDLEQAVAGLAAQLKELGSEDSLERPPGRRGRGAGPPPARPRPDRVRVVEEGAPRPSRNHHHEAPGGPLRPPQPGRPRRHRHRAARAGQPADHRRPGPRLVRHRRQRGREAGPGPRSPRPGRHRRRPRPARGDHRGPGPDLRLPLVHPARADAATPTTPSPPPAAAQRVRAISRRSVGDITGSRPTAAGPTRLSNPATTCGRRSTATQYLRDPDGTLDVSRDRRRPPD